MLAGLHTWVYLQFGLSIHDGLLDDAHVQTLLLAMDYVLPGSLSELCNYL